MILRLILALILSLAWSARAWTCDCAPWSGNVSDFADNYISVWAVPMTGLVTKGNVDDPTGGVTYTLDVLEGYDRVMQTNLSVFSDVADGGSCGINLTLGLPQFISAYKYDAETYAVSSCTPFLPYRALKLYLETGEDSFIPAWLDCHSWKKDNSALLDEGIAACAIWKDADRWNSFYGSEDSSVYNKVWLNKAKSVQPIKKRPWWSFKKD